MNITNRSENTKEISEATIPVTSTLAAKSACRVKSLGEVEMIEAEVRTAS